MDKKSVQVAIVGAGVAGLEAARVLHEHKIELIVLEARERIGGRVFTMRNESLALPIELGAEFVHGSAEELKQIARDARIAISDMAGERWQSSGGRWRPLEDFWAQLDVVMGRLRKQGADRSFEQSLKTQRARGEARARLLALQWVKNFHAADPARISEHALAEGGSPRGDVREQRLGRMINGYDAVPRWIARDVGDRVRLGAVVTAVHWNESGVRIDVREPSGAPTAAVEARAAIVTLPLGVLQAPAGEPGAISFDPPLLDHENKRMALSGMEMGTVARLTLALREPFWTAERFARRARSQTIVRLAFLHTQDEDFPVWWTTYPVDAPMLTAWCGGPRARELAMLSEEETVARAVAALGRQFGVHRREARRMVLAAWLHNWHTDPYSRGAYSYMRVGGNEAPAKLARPLKRTLFFAGEASDSAGRTGTVHGAIATGRRAAGQVLRVL